MKKKIYYIREVQNLQSDRAPTLVKAASFRGAKRIATKMQVFKGTVMTIGVARPDGADSGVMCYKVDGKWLGV